MSNDLICAGLRGITKHIRACTDYKNLLSDADIIDQAADALEAKDKRIAELDSQLSDATEAQQVLGLKLAQVEAERDALKVDAGRLDWIERMILQYAGVWFAPCGEDLRFVQLRYVGNKDSVINFPTVNGIRAAIDAAIKEQQ